MAELGEDKHTTKLLHLALKVASKRIQGREE